MLRFFIGFLIVITVAFIGYYLIRTIEVGTAGKSSFWPVQKIEHKGFVYRDLNKNGELDVYEDSGATIDERVNDLLEQMTLEEKAGTMMHPFLFAGNDGNIASPLIPMTPTSVAIFEKKINHFATMYEDSPDKVPKWTNALQLMAEKTRLGIPVSIGSDIRHGVSEGPKPIETSELGFSKWCEPLGFGAINDSTLVYDFGRIASIELRAVGIHTALHPMLDLATEPRWARIIETFGEDADVTGKLGIAYIKGFQGDSITDTSVSCMTKHFPGGGPQKDGWDAHFDYGKEQVYPGNNFAYHLEPFRKAIEAGTTQIMPYYGIPIGQTPEEIGFAFNRAIITDFYWTL